MEVILLEKIKNLGALGAKVNVKPGYGRNFLIPQGKAVPATEKKRRRVRNPPCRAGSARQCRAGRCPGPCRARGRAGRRHRRQGR